MKAQGEDKTRREGSEEAKLDLLASRIMRKYIHVV